MPPRNMHNQRPNFILSMLQAQKGSFSEKAASIKEQLSASIRHGGILVLQEYLLEVSVIPEQITYNSPEEKLFSKFTDLVLAIAFQSMGFQASVLSERSDAADLEVKGGRKSFVVDAKSFRLSRTAKNQKDFKVEAMDQWKGIRDASMIVAPLFQYPSHSSQIYEQAGRRSVCLLSYQNRRRAKPGRSRPGWKAPGPQGPPCLIDKQRHDSYLAAWTGCTDFE